jgi:hypothetical protein
VRPRLAERAERVGRGEQAGSRVQFGATDTSPIPGPVYPLVVTARYRSQRAEAGCDCRWSAATCDR